MLIQGLFYIFSTILVLAALGVIISRNPVYSALALVMCFITSAAIWLLLEAEFLAVVLVLVYVGAVMVLFLFVVMMLDVGSETLREGFWKHFPVAALVGVVIALEMAAVLIPGFRLSDAPSVQANPHECESDCPRNLLNISSARDPVNLHIPQYFHVISTRGYDRRANLRG